MIRWLYSPVLFFPIPRRECQLAVVPAVPFDCIAYITLQLGKAADRAVPYRQKHLPLRAIALDKEAELSPVLKACLFSRAGNGAGNETTQNACPGPLLPPEPFLLFA